jgi:hypothetical protein
MSDLPGYMNADYDEIVSRDNDIGDAVARRLGLREEYERGLSAGDSEAEWALYEDRGNYSAREQQLRQEAASYTMLTPEAQRLRAFVLGQCRGYRRRAWEVL